MTTNTPVNHDSLPGIPNVGRETIWTLPVSRAEPVRVRARFIGMGTSARFVHQNHVGDVATTWALPKQHCNACRWFETRIFRLLASEEDESELSGSNYLLHHSGVSIVPGEVVHYRYDAVRSAYEVIEAFTVRKHGRDGKLQDPFLTRPASRALAQAAGFDRDLEHAYVNRATA